MINWKVSHTKATKTVSWHFHLENEIRDVKQVAVNNLWYQSFKCKTGNSNSKTSPNKIICVLALNCQDSAILVNDGNYIYIQKSNSFKFSRKSYSMHKYRLLVIISIFNNNLFCFAFFMKKKTLIQSIIIILLQKM